MDLIRAYLEAIPLPLLLGLPVVVVLLALFTPAKYRLGMSISLMVVWMAVGRFADLGMPQAVAKATGAGAFLLVLAAALLHQGPRRRISMPGWAYVVLALYSFVFIATVADLALAGALRLQWLLLVLSAIVVSSRITDEDGLRYVLRWLALGFAASVGIALLALLLHPLEAFRRGVGRFEPWGANSNQIGVVFGLSAVLSLYLGTKETVKPARVFWLAICAMSAGLGLLTASRSTLVTMVIPALPTAWAMRRNPIFAAAGGLVLLTGLVLVLRNFTETTNLGRLATVETGRVDIARQYIDVIANRPAVGLLQSQNIRIKEYDEVGHHPHNAYIEMLYHGGFAYALPMLVLFAFGAFNALRVWLARARCSCDPTLLTSLVALQLLMFLHGFINGAILYPTYAWSWVCVLLIGMFGSFAEQLRLGNDPLQAETYYGEDYEEEPGSVADFEPAA